MAFSVDDRVDRVLADANVRFAYLFGSRADGSAREDSDVDVAVMTERPMDLLEQERLADRLARAMGVSELDLISLDSAGLELRGTVVQEGRTIFSADEPGRVAFEVRTRSEYLDFLPTLQAHTRRYLRALAERPG